MQFFDEEPEKWGRKCAFICAYLTASEKRGGREVGWPWLWLLPRLLLLICLET